MVSHSITVRGLPKVMKKIFEVLLLQHDVLFECCSHWSSRRVVADPCVECS